MRGEEISMTKKLDLKDIVLIGRTFDEYYGMFDLSSVRKNEKILDVASGVSSFCCEGFQKGYNITASDRIYSFSAEKIKKKCAEDLDTVMNKLNGIMNLYKWDYFKNIEELAANRKRAYSSFIADYKENNNRYILTEYPENNFKNNEFTISLVSHFLFLYDEHLNYKFHKEVINELIRITSKEIRIFPLVNLKGKRSVFLKKFMDDVEYKSYKKEIRKVDYEFVAGGNEVLIIYLN